MRPLSSSLLTLAPLTLCLLAVGPLEAAVITVCATGCDVASIQGAVNQASSGDTIWIVGSPHYESDIVVFESVTIQPVPGLGATVLGAEATANTFTVSPDVSVVLRDLGVGDGSIGIWNHGHLTLERSRVFRNDNGGIWNEGELVLRDTTVSDNEGYFAGGIWNHPGGTLEVTGSILKDNFTGNAGGNLLNEGAASLDRVVLARGFASLGGGIANTGSLAVRGRFSNNAAVSGGAIYQAGGSLEAETVDFAGNVATSSGGAVHVEGGSARFRNSSFRSNEARRGGAIFHAGSTSLRLHNTTLGDNRALDDGGAIFVDGGRRVYLASSTVAGNLADFDEDGQGGGGGFYFGSCSGLCAVTRAHLQNSIVAGNLDQSPSGPHHHECSDELTSDGYNVFQSAGTGALADCRVVGDLTGVQLGGDPMLGALTDNGGTSVFAGYGAPRTRSLQPDSPAIDAGDPGGCADSEGMPLPRDQREAERVGVCDIGAYEYGGVPGSIFSDGFESGDTSGWS